MRFENQSDASAPAREIVVTDRLDDHLDLSTFELLDIAFANQTIAVPARLSNFSALVPFNANGTDILVEVNAHLDRETRDLTLTLRAVDPATGWFPEDPLIGLLYPNDETARGEGHISFIVRPHAGLPSGTRIENRARIFFDFNDPIDTPLVFNTLDAAGPASHVLPLEATMTGTTFSVAWAGQDDAGGSGVAGFDVYVSENGGPYTVWLRNVTTTAAVFTGEQGRTYAFYSVATDNVGHRELDPSVADATITILSPLAVDAGPDQSGVEGTALGVAAATFTFNADVSLLTGTIDWGDGISEPVVLVAGAGGSSFGNSHAYSDDGEYTVTVTLSDGATTVEDSLIVTVANAAPVLQEGLEQEIAEGAELSLSVAFTDAGIADTHTATIDWGDGSVVPASVVQQAGGGLVLAGHTYADDGSYTVLVTVTDDEGDAGTATVAVTVHGVAPTAVLSSGGDVDEGSAGLVSFAGQFDPSPADAAAGFLYSYDFDNDGTFEIVAAAQPSAIVPAAFLTDGPSLRTVRARIEDKDAGFTDYTTTIEVRNSPPVIQSFEHTVREIGGAAAGTEVTLSATFSNAGLPDTHTATIDWGVGHVLPATVVQGTGSGAVNATHAYAEAGIYQVRLTVTDDDLDSDTIVSTAYVSGVAIHGGVLQVIGTAGNDRVTVTRQGKSSFKISADFLPGRKNSVTLPAAGITSVLVLLGDGNDHASIASNIELPAILDAGTGHDLLSGGGGSSVLLGREGQDVLLGGSGRNILIGGLGSDLLLGGRGEDILIGGTTSFDDDRAALAALLAEWSSDRDRDARVANLSGTGTGPRLNGDRFLIDGETVFDDDAPDLLIGGVGRDWLFLAPDDETPASILHKIFARLGDLLDR